MADGRDYNMSIMKNFFRTITLAFAVFALGAGCSGGTSATMATDAQSSPEKVVQAFYDTYMVDPDAALALVDADAQKEGKFQRTWSEIAEWTFTSAEVVSYSDPYVKVRFTIQVEGDEDTGTDDVTVKQIDGKWWIMEIPS